MVGTGEVFAALLGQAATWWVDAGGRPLGERAAERLYLEVPHPERPGRFNDRRDDSGLPINVGGLRQVMRRWPWIVAAVEALASRQAPEGRAPTLHDAWRAASMAHSAAYLARFQGGEISEEISSLYKTTLGFSRVFLTLLLDDPARADRGLGEVFGAEAFFELLDEEGWLMGSHQACAGSRASICRLYEAMASPVGSEAPAGLALEGVSLLGSRYAELTALGVAMAAATGRVIAAGRLDEAPGFGLGPEAGVSAGWPQCARICAEVQDAPCVEAVRMAPLMGPDGALSLYPAGAAPESLRGFLERLDGEDPAPLAMIDAAFVASARPVMAAIMGALGVEGAAALEVGDLALLVSGVAEPGVG